MRRLATLATAVLLSGCFNTLDWREFQSAQGRYSVTLPGKVSHNERVLATPAGPVTMHMDSTSAGSAVFGVSYADYPAGYFAHAESKAALDTVRDALVKNIGGGSVSETPIANEHYRGTSVHAETLASENKLTLDARLLIAGDRLYQVVAIGEAGDKRIDKDALDLYFNSFRITE